jgi:hypothetical protein
LPTDSQDLRLETLLFFASTVFVGTTRDDHVSNDDGASDRIFPGADERHPYRRVSIYDRLDLFRMYLQPPDIDHTVSTTQEVTPLSTPLDDIARIDKSFAVSERFIATKISESGPLGTDAKRAVLYLQLNRTWRANEPGWEPLKAVINFEPHTGLCRGIGVANAGTSVDRPEIV